MGSQSGTFYKIIVTCLLLGVSILSLTASTAADATAVIRTRRTSPVDDAPTGPTSGRLLSSAIADAASTTAKRSTGSGPTGSLQLVIGKEERSKLLAAASEPQEILLTAAQSYFIEPPTSTTTTQRPTFKRRKTSRPASFVSDKKKAPVVDTDNVNNEILQGIPVQINPFRQNTNTNFGKSRPSSDGKLGRARSRPRQQTSSDADTRNNNNNESANEIPSSTAAGEPRPFNRRRPAQRPQPSNDNGDAAPEAPKPRRFQQRKPRPSFSEGGIRNEADRDRNDEGAPPPRARSFKRQRPTSTESPAPAVKSDLGLGAIGNREDGLPQQRRVRPIRPLVASRLSNPNNRGPVSPIAAVATTTTTVAPAPVSTAEGHQDEESPFQNFFSLSEQAISNLNRPTTTTFQGLSPAPPQIPDHINNIINGIGPIPVPGGPARPVGAASPGVPVGPGTPVRGPIRGGPGPVPAPGGRKGFVLRPRASTPSSLDGENEVLPPRPPQQRRRKRPIAAGANPNVPLSPVAPTAVGPQRHIAGVVGSRVPLSVRNPGPPASPVRGGIPNSGIPRNPVSATPVPTPLQGGPLVPEIFNPSLPISPPNPSFGLISSNNPLNPSGPGFHGGVLFPGQDGSQENPLPPLKRIPSGARPNKTPVIPPFVPLPTFSGLPESFQLRDDPILEPVIPGFNLKHPESSPPVPSKAIPLRQSLRPTPAPSTGLGSIGGPLIPGFNIPSALASPIHQTLNTALNPSNNFGAAPGLFQIPPGDNLGFYPGLDKVLGVPSNLKKIEQKPVHSRFSSRTTIIPDEPDIGFNDRVSSASNENQAVVFSSAPSGESNVETNPPDYTFVTSTSTTTAAPTRKLSPLEKLQQNRRNAASKFLTPRKPTEKTTAAPPPAAKKPTIPRKSVFPPRALRGRGKSLPPAPAPEVTEDVSSKQEAEIENEPIIPSSDADASLNVVQNQPAEEADQETSSKKPSILDNAKRRRIPIPKSAPSSAPQPTRQQKKSEPVPPPAPESAEVAPPTCEEGHRYSKFLKRCVAMYKPKVQG